GIHLGVEICCDIVRSFGHRDAVFFGSPAAQVNHLAALGAKWLPGVVFPTCLSTALRASSNCSVTHQSSENFRGRTSGVRNVNDKNFRENVEGSSPKDFTPANRRPLPPKDPNGPGAPSNVR